VFDGAAGRPYRPDAEPNPLNEYGRSKLAGERAISGVLPGRSVILRTSWVYSAGGSNFLLTVLRLLRGRDQVRIVDDQVGTPTAAASLANAVWGLIEHPEIHGVHHFSDAGVASWYDFGVAIAEEAASLGLLKTAARVTPIPTGEYPRPARRPPYSVLDKSSLAPLGLSPVHWRESLRLVLREMPRV